VDTRKVNLNVIRPWAAKKIVELVGFEDEVVIEYAMGLLEDESNPVRLFHLFDRIQPTYSYETTEPRPPQNANQPDRVPHETHSTVHDRTLEALARSARRGLWSAPDVR
jgi:hypothetical protein